MVLGADIKTASIQDRSKRSKRNGKGSETVAPLPILLFRDDSPISILPAWWSISRDVELRKYWKTEGLLASSIYTMQAICSSTGFVIEGSNPRVVAKARKPIDDAEYGSGFSVLLKKVCEDWLTQDNGIFIEIEGPGNIANPLVEPPYRINHIDAGRCWRSDDPEFPVWYYSTEDMKWHKMHWTRVAFSAPNPSSIELARGLGFCAVSRVEALSSVIKSIVKYKQEKTGGRHSRGIVYGNVSPAIVEAAFEAAEEAADNANQIRFSAYPYVGSPSNNETNLGLLELSSLPDGFEWESELTLYMYCIALALGVDARELWPATSSGATKADAEIQHRKAMRKGVGDFLATMEDIGNRRVLPDGVTMAFKPKDNDEDQQQADIELTRVQTVETLVNTGIVTAKGGTLYLVNAGVLPVEYMENEELSNVAVKPEEDRSEPIVTEDTQQTEEKPSGENEPVVEDETEVTKQAAPEISPTLDADAIKRENELWENNDILKPFVVPDEAIGGYAEWIGKKVKTVRQSKKQRISDNDKQRLMDVRLALYNAEVERLAQELDAGRITPEQWQQGMADTVKSLHIGAAIIGVGGWRQITADGWRRVTQEVASQYQYLRAWTTDMASKLSEGIKDSLAAIAARAKLYGGAASATFSRFNQIDIGVDPSVLPAQPGDGTTYCQVNCRCSWEISVIDAKRGDWDAAWMMHPAEHCVTCIARSEKWAPFKVRGGVPLPGQVNGRMFG